MLLLVLGVVTLSPEQRPDTLDQSEARTGSSRPIRGEAAVSPVLSLPPIAAHISAIQPNLCAQYSASLCLYLPDLCRHCLVPAITPDPLMIAD